MFHTSSYRHEQYISRSKSTHSNKLLSPIKRYSIESEISRTDSGYASCTSKQQLLTSSNDSLFTSTIAESTAESRRTSEEESIILKTLEQQQQKQKKSTTSKFPRQPDLVYSCPRPLAFPFHNDDQFLPIAEADPRDVARISPSHKAHSLSRSTCSTSVKQKILTFDRYGTYKSSASQPFSYNSENSNNGGTVRSLRSIFQIPEATTLSNSKKKVHPAPPEEHHHPLKKLEIKKGTVQSIKDMFTKLDSGSSSPPLVTSKGEMPRKKSNRVGATVRQYDANVTKNESSSYTHLVKDKSFTKKAFAFASSIWQSNTQKVSASELPYGAATTTNLIKTEIKNFSARMLALPWLNTKKDKEQKQEEKDEEEEEEIKQIKKKDDTIITTTSKTVGKLWKSFKRFVVGK
ncbi:hypothetical protein K501DRAFT_285256 [Backusella circina FSU 941]|nr:hypothetical protein K501DRAFT_285256 [Backusella circina FSU 941]